MRVRYSGSICTAARPVPVVVTTVLCAIAPVDKIVAAAEISNNLLMTLSVHFMKRDHFTKFGAVALYTSPESLRRDVTILAFIVANRQWNPGGILIGPTEECKAVRLSAQLDRSAVC